MSARDAIWITGVGTANPLGTSYAESADGLLAGRSGIGPITHFDTTSYRCKIGGRLPALPTATGWSSDEFDKLESIERLFVHCGEQALRDAGCWDQRDQVRVGLALGYGAEWAVTWESDWHRGGRQIFDPATEPDDLIRRLQRYLGIAGPILTVAAACASSNHALAIAQRWVELGVADICLAGGGEMGVTPMSLACFGNLGALTRRNDNPTSASRPFDASRDGIALSEGGALFVLERAERARKRGVVPRAEVLGFGATSDAAHMVIPSRDAEPAARAVRFALHAAKLNPEDVDYVNAHATSTPVGDPCESRALQSAFGEAVRTLPVSATKSMTGHALSGAAALGTLASLVALDRQAVPPTINLETPDPECALCHVPQQAQERKLNVAAINSFGFGGSNTCLVLRKAA